MKIFKKRTQKSGYSNMSSEPISDLDPKRISALKNIKSKHHGDLDPKVISAIKNKWSSPPQEENDNKTVSLTPSPSLSKPTPKRSISESNSAGSPAGFTASETITACTPPDNDLSNEKNNASPIHKKLFASPSESKVKNSSKPSPSAPKLTPEKKRAKEVGSGEPKPPPKTPETFFQGKNRKKFQIDINEFASQVPVDPLNAFSGDQDHQIEEEEDQQLKHPSDRKAKQQIPVNLERSNSTSSDLDKTFSPEIISVTSDITEPSYHRTSSRKTQKRSWRKWKRIREDFSDTCRQHDMRSTLSVLDTILDTLCSGPSNKK